MKITKGYIQGAFDSEGHLSKTGHSHGEWWVLGFTNTDLVWLQAIAHYLKSKDYHPYVRQDDKRRFSKRKPVYVLYLRQRREIKRFLQEFPPLMASRQKKAAEFLLWDRYYKRHFPKGSDSVLQQAMDILDNSQGQGRLL